VSGPYVSTVNAAAGVRPLVSVVIPTFNRAGYLRTAVGSVLNQTYPEIEVVVADDGSTDETAAVLSELAEADSRVRWVRSTGNRGAQAARNDGIRASGGEWISFLDSDDRYLADSVARRLAAALGTGRRVVHSDAVRVAANGSRSSYRPPALDGWVRRELLRHPGTLFPSLLVHRDVLDKIGLLDETIKAWQEWETAIRLSEISEFAFLSDPTFEYNERTPGAISEDLSRAAQGYEQIVSKHRRAIVREVGIRALSRHYAWIAGLRAQVSRRRALRAAVMASVLWPPTGLRVLVAMARR
jgi:glycosyltransferase involved in cell wall biosynthesis